MESDPPPEVPLESNQLQRSFTILLDKHLSQNIIDAQWCPTMDLVAVLVEDGQLHLHRLNWQRLWNYVPESPIKAFTWRPDGKQLCIGHRDGSISLLSSENGGVDNSREVFDEPVQSVCWTHSMDLEAESLSDKNESGNKERIDFRQRDRRFLEPPFDECREGVKGSSTKTFEYRLSGRNTAKWPSQISCLSLITCVSSTGRLVVCSNSLLILVDTFFIPRPWLVDASIVANNEGVEDRTELPSTHTRDPENHRMNELSFAPTICSAMSRDISEISACWRDVAGNVCIGRRATPCLGGDAKNDIFNFCLSAASILHDAKESCKVSKIIMEEVEKVTKAKLDLVKELDQLLRAHGMDTDAQGDFLLLVTMGEYSHAMEQFLTSSMKESGLKRMSKLIDHALSAAHEILIDRLIPAVESLAFRLAEIRGLAAKRESSKAFGFHADDVYRIESVVLEQIVTMERLRVRLIQVSSQYRTFFSWLVTALRRFPEDTVDTHMGYPLSHIDRVRIFLHGEFKNGTLEKIVGKPEVGRASSSIQTSEDFRKGTDQVDRMSEEECDARLPYDNLSDKYLRLDDRLFRLEEESFEYFLAAIEDGINQSSKPVESLTNLNSGFGGTEVFPLSDSAGLVPKLEHSMWMCESLFEISKRHLSNLISNMPVSLNILFPAIGGNDKEGQTDLTDERGAGNEKKFPRLTINYDSNESGMEEGMDIEKSSDRLIVNMPIVLTANSITAETPLEQNSSFLIQASVSTLGTRIDFCAAALPIEMKLLDIGTYKHNEMAFLVEKDSQGQLILVPNDLLTDFPHVTEKLDFNADLIEKKMKELQPIHLDDCRGRQLPYNELKSPLAVSGTRGVAFVLNGVQRGLIVDLVEDEEEEYEEDNNHDERNASDMENTPPRTP